MPSWEVLVNEFGPYIAIAILFFWQKLWPGIAKFLPAFFRQRELARQAQQQREADERQAQQEREAEERKDVRELARQAMEALINNSRVIGQFETTMSTTFTSMTAQLGNIVVALRDLDDDVGGLHDKIGVVRPSRRRREREASEAT